MDYISRFHEHIGILMTHLSLNMQSYRKSDALFCGAEIFIRYNCMCTDKFAPSFHFYPCSSLQVGSKQIEPIIYFHTRPSKWPKIKESWYLMF